MKILRRYLFHLYSLPVFISAFLLLVGCGQITDKDRIKIAKIGDKYITRGDLFRIIRDMPDIQRPMIRNRSDMLRVLNQHINSRIKIPLGQELAKEGKIEVPREVARETFFPGKWRRSGSLT